MPEYHWSSDVRWLAGRISKLSLRSVLQEGPAALQVADEAVGLVLGGDRDAADARIEGVGQGEIDDARLAAEEHGGLGPLVGQLHQAAAATAGQHIGHRFPRQTWILRYLGHRCSSRVLCLCMIIALGAAKVALPHGDIEIGRKRAAGPSSAPHHAIADETVDIGGVVAEFGKDLGGVLAEQRRGAVG